MMKTRQINNNKSKRNYDNFKTSIHKNEFEDGILNDRKYLVKNETSINGKCSCDICGKKYDNRAHMIRHKRIHTGEKPYACDTCDLKLNQSPNMIRHKRIHTGEKPYTCDICDLKFNQSQSMIRHKIKMHNFRVKLSLKEKQRNKAQMKIRSSHTHNDYTKSCNICGRKFSHLQSLIRHRQIHTGSWTKNEGRIEESSRIDRNEEEIEESSRISKNEEEMEARLMIDTDEEEIEEQIEIVPKLNIKRVLGLEAWWLNEDQLPNTEKHSTMETKPKTKYFQNLYSEKNKRKNVQKLKFIQSLKPSGHKSNSRGRVAKYSKRNGSDVKPIKLVLQGAEKVARSNKKAKYSETVDISKPEKEALGLSVNKVIRKQKPFNVDLSKSRNSVNNYFEKSTINVSVNLSRNEIPRKYLKNMI